MNQINHLNLEQEIRVEINDESRGTNTGNDIKCKTAILRSNLCDYSDIYILVKGTITITGDGDGDDDSAKRTDERDKRVIFKNCAPFTKCISRISNTYIDNAKDIDIVMSMNNLIEYCDNYSKTSEVYINTTKMNPMIT